MLVAALQPNFLLTGVSIFVAALWQLLVILVDHCLRSHVILVNVAGTR